MQKVVKNTGKILHGLAILVFFYWFADNWKLGTEWLIPAIFAGTYGIVVAGWILESRREKQLQNLQSSVWVPATEKVVKANKSILTFGIIIAVIGLFSRYSGQEEAGFGIMILGICWSLTPYVRPKSGILLSPEGIEVRQPWGHFRVDWTKLTGVEVNENEILFLKGKFQKSLTKDFIDDENRGLLMREINRELVARGREGLTGKEELTGEF